ncbi:flagellar basal-body rod protein FlgG [Amaricoccus tamworthensis]|uniref:flagellar basal-body rod protein FlgG n=1 Tax=Amaricoccus tamworthensis TaxID=57002 RepID=UPI003C7A9AC5
MRALSIAATGMAAQQKRVEVISHNIANSNTTAYNARRAEFSDLHYQQVVTPGSISSADGTVIPAGVQLGLGVRTSAVSMHVQQGALRETNGALDIAVDGQGYLEVTLPNGEAAYTRDGALKRNGEGLIVTNDGFAVVPDVTIPEETVSLTINADGEIYALFEDQIEPQLLGQFSLVTFINQKGLEAMGDNLYRETEASGQPNVGDAGEDGRGIFRQGYLEESSVDAVRELTDLIEAQRGYELNSKVITASDQMLSATVQIR